MIEPLGGPGASGALPLFVAAGTLLALSGVPGLFFSWRSAHGERLATILVVVGSSIGLAGVVLALGTPGHDEFGFPSPVPGSHAGIGVDPLGAFFAMPVFLIGGLGAIYGASYWSFRCHRRNSRRLRFCYGLLLASMIFITLAQDGIVLLVAWEFMALTNFVAITAEEDDVGVRRAGWLYLLYSHVTILSLFAFFALGHGASGDFRLAAIPAGEDPLRTGLFVLALVGFGIKAGVMPLHSWLPSAHASAPSHVSAVMSGVVIKMGVYGLARVCGLVGNPPLGWGLAILALGALSAVFGVVFALAQHDLKKLLAYHSIENIGIILLGLGLAMVGRTEGRADWVMLGMGGCLLHVWNHALFKSLLFFGAGSVVHATGTRDLEQLGGLARRMPWTAGLFFLGSVAICGLPPLNGFVSEFLVYLGLARGALTPGASWVALPAPALAATGALAVACFVKVYGVVFLGTARAPAAGEAHESPAAMLWPMGVLAAGCALVGVAPIWVARPLERAVGAWAGGAVEGERLADLAPLGWITATGGALVIAGAAIVVMVVPVCRRARRRQPALSTWACGYAAGSARVQYTASSFAEGVTSRFGWVLFPRVHQPRIDKLFPAPARFHTQVEDSVLDRLLLPGVRRVREMTGRVRIYHQGNLQQYVLYIAAAVAALLLFNLRLDWLVITLCGN